MKKKNNLLETLKPMVKRLCPVVPPTKLDEWQVGVFVGQARGAQFLIDTMTADGFLTEDEQDELVALLTNGSVEEIKAQRALAEEHNKEMEDIEEQQRNEQE